MQILIYVLIAFGLVGFCCTLLCVACGTDLSELLPVYKPKKKKVAATFWGHYEETSATDEESFQLPKISQNDEDYVIGSSVYASGKAVRSLRK